MRFDDSKIVDGLEGSRLTDRLVIGRLAGRRPVGGRFVGSWLVGGRLVGGKLRLLTQIACSLICALHSLVGSFCSRRQSTGPTETFKFNSNRTRTTCSSVQFDKVVLNCHDLSIYLSNSVKHTCSSHKLVQFVQLATFAIKHTTKA